MNTHPAIRIFIFVLSVIIPTVGDAQDSRGILFNSDWKFYKGDVPGGEKYSFDDSKWSVVQVPHDWSIEGPFSESWASGTGYLPAGIGWYRKSFSVPDPLSKKTIYLYFDGVYKNSEVWINEHYLGKRPNGYASFYYDVTPHLKGNGSNLITVRVDHTDFSDSRWYTGSGINRNVYLIATEKVHINVWGVSFTALTVSKESATAAVGVSIRNSSGKGMSARVRCELSFDGKVIASAEEQVSINRSEHHSTLSLSVKNPRLWSPDEPNLYKLSTTIVVNGKIHDDVTEIVGFRNFAFNANTGFTLNGEPVKLKGVCFHDDAGALGSAVPKAVWERRLHTLKEMGCNAIRMSHNPHQDYLYELCDRLGFLVQDEAFDEWEIGKNKWIAGWNVGTPGKDGYHSAFNEWAERDLRDMILRNRNRASIIMWSIGNEIDYPNDPYTHEILNTGNNPQIYGRGYQPGNPPAKRLGEIAERLVKVVKDVDSTRLVTAALAGVVMSNTTTYPESLDLVGYNYQEYRYVDDHKKYPNRIIYGSENGKSVEAWQAVADNEFISGQFLWTAFDFLGEARAWPVRSSGAGLIDLAGFPKPHFYQRKAMWSDESVIRLAASRRTTNDTRRGDQLQSHWNWNLNDSVRIVCFTNVDEAELILNGKSLGTKNPAEEKTFSTTWDVLYTPGILEVVGYREGREVARDKMVTTGDAEMIAVSASKNKIKADNDDVVHLEIVLMDKNGVLVGNASNEVSMEIQGPGKLIGMESGSLSSHEDYKSNRRKCVNGKVLAYIQAQKKGLIKIVVSSSKLKSYEIEIVAE